jgi:predicted molibdopterin-dependent oxidoreductase YjgC
MASALITPTVQSGQVFIPMHYAEVNLLTHPSFDPHSRQPSYKHCAVSLERIDAKKRQPIDLPRRRHGTKEPVKKRELIPTKAGPSTGGE